MPKPDEYPLICNSCETEFKKTMPMRSVGDTCPICRGKIEAKEIEKTKVIFRKWPDGDVIAIFPEMLGTNDYKTCGSYMHFGQHGSCDPEIISDTKPCDPLEYLDLEMELEDIGYNLEIIQRYRRVFTEKRMTELRNQ